MRIYAHNPRRFPKHTWNYRLVRLRHALGWSKETLAEVSGLNIHTINMLERGMRGKRLSIDTIRRIKAVEEQYKGIIKAFDKRPVRLNRLKSWDEQSGVKLLPIEVNRSSNRE